MTTNRNVLNKAGYYCILDFNIKDEIEAFKRNPTEFNISFKYLDNEDTCLFIESFLPEFMMQQYNEFLYLELKFAKTKFTYNSKDLHELSKFIDCLNEYLIEGENVDGGRLIEISINN